MLLQHPLAVPILAPIYSAVFLERFLEYLQCLFIAATHLQHVSQVVGRTKRFAMVRAQNAMGKVERLFAKLYCIFGIAGADQIFTVDEPPQQAFHRTQRFEMIGPQITARHFDRLLTNLASLGESFQADESL